jgi:hypothetical protein
LLSTKSALMSRRCRPIRACSQSATSTSIMRPSIGFRRPAERHLDNRAGTGSDFRDQWHLPGCLHLQAALPRPRYVRLDRRQIIARVFSPDVNDSAVDTNCASCLKRKKKMLPRPAKPGLVMLACLVLALTTWSAGGTTAVTVEPWPGGSAVQTADAQLAIPSRQHEPEWSYIRGLRKRRSRRLMGRAQRPGTALSLALERHRLDDRYRERLVDRQAGALPERPGGPAR